METTMLIEKRFENLFRECTCQFNSMAIAESYKAKYLANYLYFIVESTDDEQDFVDDLFTLGKMYGELKEFEEHKEY